MLIVHGLKNANVYLVVHHKIPSVTLPQVDLCQPITNTKEKVMSKHVYEVEFRSWPIKYVAALSIKDAVDVFHKHLDIQDKKILKLTDYKSIKLLIEHVIQ